MKSINRSLCLLLAFAIILSTSPSASAKDHRVSPDEARTIIIKQGIDRYIAIQETNGLHVWGRILAIRPNDFDIQLHHQSNVTAIPYADVDQIWTNSPGKAFALFGAVAVTLTVVGYLIYRHEVNKQNADGYAQCIQTFTPAQCTSLYGAH